MPYPVEWEIIGKAPSIKPLKVVKPKMEFLDFEETERLIEAADDEWRAMVIVAFHTGLRLGELLALRWEDVDLVRRRLIVRQSNWRGKIGTPKGHRQRELPLNDLVLNALKKHRLRHSFASHLVMRGVPMKAVQELLGHTTRAMTERYAHLSPDVRTNAVNALLFAPERQSRIWSSKSAVKSTTYWCRGRDSNLSTIQ